MCKSLDSRTLSFVQSRAITTLDQNKIPKIKILPQEIKTPWNNGKAIWGSFHKAILATIDLSYLQLILRLLALIFTSAPQNIFKTIVIPAHVKKKISVSSNKCSNFVFVAINLQSRL